MDPVDDLYELIRMGQEIEFGQTSAARRSQVSSQAASIFEDSVMRELDGIVGRVADDGPSLPAGKGPRVYQMGGDRNTVAPDFFLPKSDGQPLPVAIEAKVWFNAPKSIGNRISESLRSAVRFRRDFKGPILLGLVVAIVPSGNDFEPTPPLRLDGIFDRLSELVRRHSADAGFDRILVGIGNGYGGWFIVNESGPSQTGSFSSGIAQIVAQPVEPIIADLSSRPILAVDEYKPTPATDSSKSSTNSRRTFLLVADEWWSMHGGISTVNRELAIALAGLDQNVYVLLPNASAAESDHASAKGVTLVVPDELTGVSGKQLLLTRPRLPAGAPDPDFIVGHGRILGPYAQAQRALFFTAAQLVHFVHMDAEMLERAKEIEGGASRMRTADDRRSLEISLSQRSDLVAGVGPLLKQSIEHAMRGALTESPPVIEFTPGLRDWGGVVNAEHAPDVKQVLLVARADDILSKGIDIALSATASAFEEIRRNAVGDDPILVLRGVPNGMQDEVKGYLESVLVPNGKVYLRPFTSNEEDVRRDLWQSRLVLMPSRHEGFGLAALEAISAGVPVLITEESGLAKTIANLDVDGDRRRPREILTVSGDSSDVAEIWSEEISRILKDPQTAYGRASSLRTTLAGSLSWSSAARNLLAALGVAP